MQVESLNSIEINDQNDQLTAVACRPGPNQSKPAKKWSFLLHSLHYTIFQNNIFNGQRSSMMISFHEQLKWPSFFFITLVTEHQCEFRLGKMYFIE